MTSARREDAHEALELSVVIPTFNRSAVLEKCLKALEQQTLPARRFEIVVADDGSSDGTRESAQAFAARSPGRVLYLHQANAGANAARNRALERVSGRLVLFINDDVIATPAMCAEHVAAHERWPSEPVAVLGRVTLSPELRQTPLTRLHLDLSYARLAGRELHDWRAFFTCNVSVKRSFLARVGRFEERLRYHEDLELSQRLSERGLSVVYRPAALGYHDHSPSEPEFFATARRDGAALAQWYALAPRLGDELASVGFYPTAGVLRRLRCRLGDLVINPWTRPAWLRLARAAATKQQALAAGLYAKLYEAAKREAIRLELARGR